MQYFNPTTNGNNPTTTKQQQKVCFYWKSGRCTRHPCHFLHSDAPSSTTVSNPNTNPSRPHTFRAGSGNSNSSFSNTWGSGRGRGGGVGGGSGLPLVKVETICNYWVQGDCRYGDRCKFLHSWCVGDSFSLLTTLEGHTKVVTGIALPAGKGQLYTASKDEHVRIWDCQSGQPPGGDLLSYYTTDFTLQISLLVFLCINTIHLGGEIGCMFSEGPWVFIGLQNMVKAWNVETFTDMSLSGPGGLVYALAVGNDMLFAGVQDGALLAWKFNPVTNCFEPAASLTGHTGSVVTMVVGANRLYSGSMDNSIRVWNLETLQCMQTLTGHTSVVTSVLCWDQFLLSSSLDNTIKVWAATLSGNLEATYTHTEDHGLLTLRGICDSEGKPILMCSSNDNTVRLYDLPSFMERGKLFSKQEIRAIESGPGGLFFTGDGNGLVRVWQCKTG